ncbi:helix-turn-helix domain-containing protein [Halopelagius longus]|uniref:Bacterio-opsin activator n=1 Tax=Halopelagius longus TaxID=1236180 RepID=A0A1H1EVU3_9EURY|nr:helix-turn-helix domain-containing protein [Halopelagius longus]RDI71904.1 bacterio-opsin activator [Halopelagius longus]SDQ92654.1 Predicted DNA binding protein, contains HTH domain [Halopelagius longus]
MKYLDAKLSQPRWMLHPMQEFIRDGDAVRYEELQAWSGVTGDREVEHELFYVEADREPYEDALRAVDSVRWYDLTPIDDGSFYVYICQETRPEDVAWREAFADLNLVLVPPVVYDADAAFHVTLVGPGEDLRTVLSDLPDVVDATVKAVGEYDRRHAPVAGELTARQLTAVETAVELGFYEVPRRAGVADVADELDCAPSTASDLLQRAESSVMRRVVERNGRGRPDG